MVNTRLKNRAQFAEIAGVSGAAITKACKGILKPALVGKRINIDHKAAVEYLQKKENERNPEIAATGLDPAYEDAVAFCVNNEVYSANQIHLNLGIPQRRALKIVATMKALGIVPEPDEPPPIIETPQKKPRVIRGQTKHVETKKSEALRNLNENVEQGQTIHEIPADIVKFADMTLRELIQRFGSDVAFLDWLKATKAIEEINEKRLKNAQTRGDLVSRELVRRGIIEPIESAHIKLLTDGSKAMAVRASALIKADEPVESVEKYIAEQITSFIRPVKTKVKRALRDI